MPITLVQFAQGHNTVAGASAVVPFAAPVTAGNLLVVFIGTNFQHFSVSPTDTLANAWTLAYIGNIESPSCDLWFAVANATGACTITVPTGVVTGVLSVIIAEFSGVSVLDQINANGPNPIPPSTINTNAITTTVANELILSSAYDTPTEPIVWGVDSGMTNIATEDNTDLLSGSLVASFKVVAAIVTINPLYTAAGTAGGDSLLAGIASFFGTSVPPAPPGAPNKNLLALSPRPLPWPSRQIPIPPQKDYKSVM